ncbi:GtrA family protein [Microbacteriaceae bacterium VKM Ac-2854]|nr:GtrA family protein [Microbacteriaceae bacterium VKM Ac-2854]
MRRLLSAQKTRFLVAGCLNTALDFAILNALTLLAGLPALVANVVSVVVGITISYLLNHHFVFRHPTKVSWRRFGQFFLVTGFSSLVLQSLIIYGFEAFFDTRFGTSLLFLSTTGENRFLALNVAKVAAVSVGLVWNFCMYKFVVFRRPTVEALAQPTAVEAASTPVSR